MSNSAETVKPNEAVPPKTSEATAPEPPAATPTPAAPPEPRLKLVQAATAKLEAEAVNEPDSGPELEESKGKLAQLAQDHAREAWKIGDEINRVVDRRMIERSLGRYKTLKDFAKDLSAAIPYTTLMSYAAVARRFTEEQARTYGTSK